MIARSSSLSDLTLIYCGNAGLGQISRSFSLNRSTIRLKRSKNLTPTGVPSLRSVKSDRLLDRNVISAEIFTALLLMAAASTMLTMPMVRRSQNSAPNTID